LPVGAPVEAEADHEGHPAVRELHQRGADRPRLQDDRKDHSHDGRRDGVDRGLDVRGDADPESGEGLHGGRDEAQDQGRLSAEYLHDRSVLLVFRI
jgi:hypothetical protein